MSSNESFTSKGSAEAYKVRCDCNLKCALYTSHREHSLGRKFWRCPRNRSSEDCGYFLWVDNGEENHSRILAEVKKLSKEIAENKTQNKFIIAMLFGLTLMDVILIGVILMIVYFVILKF